MKDLAGRCRTGNRYKGLECDQMDVCRDLWLLLLLWKELRVGTAGQSACPQMVL